MASPLYRGLWERGMIHHMGDTALVLGTRFLPERALHFSLLEGDLPQAIAYAVAQGKKRGVPKLTCMIPSDRLSLRKTLEEAGFQFGSEILMLERNFA